MISQSQIDDIKQDIEHLEEEARKKLRSILPRAPDFIGITTLHVDGTDWLIALARDGRVFQHEGKGWSELPSALLPVGGDSR